MNTATAAMRLGLAAACLASALCAADEASLPGDALRDASGPTPSKPTLAVPGGFERGWEKQPPMIPHPIDKYSIDLRQNGCLKCHSPATFEVAKAPKVGDSHFLDRDGQKLDHLAPRRYFCTQCHAPQTGAIPLVDNVFEGN